MRNEPYWRNGWFWATIALVLVGLRFMVGGVGVTEVSSPPKEVTEEISLPVKADQTSTKDPGSWRITMSEFAMIDHGMTYSEVVDIAGMLGTLVSEAGETGTESHTTIYQFEGEGGLGANAIVTFQDGRVIGKAQFNLE